MKWKHDNHKYLNGNQKVNTVRKQTIFVLSATSAEEVTVDGTDSLQIVITYHPNTDLYFTIALK